MWEDIDQPFVDIDITLFSGCTVRWQPIDSRLKSPQALLWEKNRVLYPSLKRLLNLPIPYIEAWAKADYVEVVKRLDGYLFH